VHLSDFDYNLPPGQIAQHPLADRAASRLLSAAGISIVRSYVGNYATSLEMAGCSVTLMRLTSRLKPLLLAPAHSPALVQV